MGFYVGQFNIGQGLDNTRPAHPIFGTGLDNPSANLARPIDRPTTYGLLVFTILSFSVGAPQNLYNLYFLMWWFNHTGLLHQPQKTLYGGTITKVYSTTLCFDHQGLIHYEDINNKMKNK